MIGWEDIYKVITAMFPLYAALILGYGSVKWWHMFKPDHCDAINQLNCYFIMPLFTFDFTTRINPYKMNFRFLAADGISKAIILLAIYIWAKFSTKGNYPWSITTFSLSTLNNTLVVGVPLMSAMYGPFGENLVIQSSILQFTIWIIILLVMYAFRSVNKSLDQAVTPNESPTDLEGNIEADSIPTRPSLLILLKVVGVKLAKNPNSYACILGLAWALVSNRWNLKMPSIIDGSVQIMSRAGLFMALQEKIIDCGATLTAYGMLLRFVVAPATMAVGSLAVGLRGDVLCIAIIQAALPQAIASFVFAKEYELHTSVLSTAVIFGTIVSIPVLIAYYVVLDLLST
ncbi:Auxin efflux carrier [Cynara cardunculus var. scolymus]|uniref:Auxin efflux carrier n=1 Tax=Cynara cardunculus var. scolymus TaxID=59895 RepID=A0A103XJU6_CYNCS|nr:Auxin efflux carrier [Cynara cardunculus var. scolymus]